ncbi:zinc-binding dehydrogenase [Furfurilactobacillus milii]|nr:zinc-binding dehydrogenase [Furfurilactobacillus milii]
MMLAMVLNHPGDEHTFHAEERAIPVSTSTDSVLKIMAFGLNYAELLTRNGESPDVKFPRVIGIEAVGTVSDTANDSSFHVGQTVMTLMGGLGRAFDGSYEEYALIPNHQLYPLPVKDSWAQLATIPESFYTAYGSLNRLRLSTGAHLLIRGGTSNAGIAALLLAKAMGYTVSTTSRNSDKLTILQNLGADETLLDRGSLETTTSFDGILELVGTSALRDSLQHLATTGTVVVTGGLGGEWSLPDFSPFEVPGYLTNFQSTNVNAQLLSQAVALIKDHRLQLPIAQTFELIDIAQAHQAMVNSHKIGKIVVIANHD